MIWFKPHCVCMELKERIRFARFQAGFRGHGSLARFSRETGIRENTLYCYETGRYAPSAAKLATIADTTGADLSWLITGREQNERK